MSYTPNEPSIQPTLSAALRFVLPVALLLCQCLFLATSPVAAVGQNLTGQSASPSTGSAQGFVPLLPPTDSQAKTAPLVMFAAPSPAFSQPILPTVVDPMNPDNRIALFLEDKYWQAHNSHLMTPRQLGANGCAAALWEYAIRPALLKHGQLKTVPTHLQVTYDILNYYKTNHLGQIIQIDRAELDAAKVPPGSTLIGIKRNGDHHMLGAIELEGRWRELPPTKTAPEAFIPEERDGFSEAFVGNTGLQQFVKEVGYAHVRIQEFSRNHDVARLNHHHGAIDGGNAGNPYSRFIILTWRKQPVDVSKDS